MRQIKLTQLKNVIRFPIEKRLNQMEEEKNLVKKPTMSYESAIR